MGKKILFITSNIHAPWGGSEELWSQTAARLSNETTIKVGAIVRKWEPTPQHIINLITKEVDIFYMPETPKSLIARLQHFIYNTMQKSGNLLSKKKLNLIRAFSPDLVVHSMGSNMEGYDWMHFCKELSIPYVNLVQLATEYHWNSDQIIDQYVEGYTGALHNYFVSQKNLEITATQLAIRLSNASVTWNPFKVSGTTIPYPSTEQGFFLACPASLSALHKGHDILFEVLAQKKWKERELQLNLYGKGKNENSLKRLKTLLGLTNVHFKGFVNNVDQIWERNHALVLASRMEGLPLALIEAMMSGRVSIVTNVAGIPEVITDEENGYIAKAPNAELFDEALERAWENKGDWQQMGLKAAKAIRKLIPEEPIQAFSNKIKAHLE